MDFFEQQEQARRQSRKLVWLFALAVLGILLASNAALLALWNGFTGAPLFSTANLPKHYFLANTLVVCMLIAGGTAIEFFRLREGGDAVAKMVGGRLVMPSTTDYKERRLLNVVEEMALASGVACPRVYVLDQEEGINAFAAGYNQDQAVVAVTKGTLARLNRDELQGVVAHEFSHILNGDMRLNVRLIGLLFGIQMIAGFGMQMMQLPARARMGMGRSRGNGNDGAQVLMALMVFGAALFVIGYIGIFFGRLIKAAVSRQREFLADASAVQFTRNPDGIGNALRKIGGYSATSQHGSYIAHPNAEHLSHLFLGAARRSFLNGWLATHPPLQERLRRIFGKQMATMDAPVLSDPPGAEQGASMPDIAYVASGFSAQSVSAQGSAPTPAQANPMSSYAASGRKMDVSQLALVGTDLAQGVSSGLQAAVHEPMGASALVMALVFDPNNAAADAQRACIDAHDETALARIEMLAKELARLPASARLPLLDRAMPSLLLLTQAQRDALFKTVAAMIDADSKRTLAEFVIETVLARRLSPEAGRATPIRFSRLAELREDCALLMSLVAHVGAAQVVMGADELFLLGARACPDLNLRKEDFREAASMNFVSVREALERVHQLAPLPKPILIKALLASGGRRDPMPVALADLLRAICAAIESPVPPVVAATYTSDHW